MDAVARHAMRLTRGRGDASRDIPCHLTVKAASVPLQAASSRTTLTGHTERFLHDH